MGVAIDVEQMRGIDAGIDLRRAEARMAEQFLERTQVGAAPEQVSGEAVPQSMRRRPSAEPEPYARAADCAPDNVRR
jgi:hypothetical protein